MHAMSSNPHVLEKQEDRGIYITPAATPNTYRAVGWVSRGFKDQNAAIAFGRETANFFSGNGLNQPVFVVRGPTSTCREPFEVTDGCSTYSVVARIQTEPATQPRPGMALRTAIINFGLESLRGVPLDDGCGEQVYIHQKCLDSDIDLYKDEPTQAFRLSRFYGGDSPDAQMTRWIYTGTTRIGHAHTEAERERPAAERERA
ncbi:hypothetical protein [Ramlibacter sp. AN1133]|uniref:hypothetical protein n=1 Tax=Ramlibacter sp. AN1133 TaxID=3133429 RepID=UPI0030BB3D5C